MKPPLGALPLARHDPTCHAHPPDEPDTGRIVDLKTLRVGVLDGWSAKAQRRRCLTLPTRLPERSAMCAE